MALTLRIKRRLTGAAGSPVSLANAELAYNEVDHTLYYGEGTGGTGGSATTVVPIGGAGNFVNLSGIQTISGVKTIASPVLTGIPLVPTAAVNTNTTQAASTAYVVAQAAAATPLVNGTAAVGTSLRYARGDHVHPTQVSAAMADVVGAATIPLAVAQLGAIGTVTTSTPVLQFDFTESLALGSGFFDGIVVNATRSGGTGHRQAFTSQITVTGATAAEFMVGGALFGFMNSGSGQIFGGNSWAGTAAAVASTANAVSFEANTDVRNNITSKVGLNLVDVATSTGDGTAISTGVYLVRQPGGFGYQTGIQFGDDFTVNMGGARTTLIRSGNASGAVSCDRGIDLRTASFTAAAIDLPANGSGAGSIAFNTGLGGSVQSQTASAGPAIVLGSSTFAVQNTAGSSTALSVQTITPFTTLFLGSAAPSVDNSVNSGGSANRWATVFAATGTINTSDGRLKSDVAPLPSTLAAVVAIKPITYRWKSGGAALVDVVETQTVQATRTVSREVEQVEIRDGTPVMTKVPQHTEEPIFDEVPLLDEQRQPVIQHVPARPAVILRNGVVRSPATVAHDIARTHRVPRMVQKEVVVQRPVERPGKRTHWGFLAADIKAEMDKLGMDFAGYVLTEEGTEALRPDQLLPVLWKAFQEHVADFQAYKAEHGG